MSDYYDHGGAPADASYGDSSVIRAELTAVQNGISKKLPPLSGHPNEVVVINAGATKMVSVASSGTGNFVRSYGTTLTDATLVNPILGTPASGNASNLTNTIAPQTNAATSKAIPVDADAVPLIDSAASFGLKKLTWANLKAAMDIPAIADTGLKPIDYAFSSGSLILKLDPSTTSFRDASLTNGAPVSVSNAAQITTTISSGSTGGTVSAVQSDILVLEMNIAGVKELAWTNAAGALTLDGLGLITTVADGGAGGADSANVIYSTTARTNVAYKIAGLFRSTQTTAGTWAQTPSLVAGAGTGVDIQPAKSMVRLNTANGYGSTNTAIRRFTNVVTNQGADITYTDSATLGATFTINKAGVYGINYIDSFNAAADAYITLNSSQLTIAPTTIADILAVETAAVAAYRVTLGTIVALKFGDVVRAHTAGTPVGSTNQSLFTITRIN